MTDAERIARARQLVAEITHALDCAELGWEQGRLGIYRHALREKALIAAMLAADDLIHSLGGA